MKRITFATLASCLAIAAAMPASAAIVFGVGYNGGAVTQVATDAGLGIGGYMNLAGGYFSTAGAAGFPILSQPNLQTQSLSFHPGGAGGVLNVYVTQTDLSAFTGTFTSSFTSNTASNANAVIRSFYSTSNALFGGTQLQSATFNSLGTYSFSNAISAVGPFSTTVRYDITFGDGLGSFNGTGNLTAASAAVPEPATWAMMLLGFAGLGYATRRRQKIGARIRFA